MHGDAPALLICRSYLLLPAQEAHRQQSRHSSGSRVSGAAAAAARLLHAPARLLRGSIDSQVCLESPCIKAYSQACSVPTSAESGLWGVLPTQYCVLEYDRVVARVQDLLASHRVLHVLQRQSLEASQSQPHSLAGGSLATMSESTIGTLSLPGSEADTWDDGTAADSLSSPSPGGPARALLYDMTPAALNILRTAVSADCGVDWCAGDGSRAEGCASSSLESTNSLVRPLESGGGPEEGNAAEEAHFLRLVKQSADGVGVTGLALDSSAVKALRCYVPLCRLACHVGGAIQQAHSYVADWYVVDISPQGGPARYSLEMGAGDRRRSSSRRGRRSSSIDGGSRPMPQGRPSAHCVPAVCASSFS